MVPGARSRKKSQDVSRIEAACDEQPDVVVAVVSNGAYLKSRVSVPVVVISPTDGDVIHALAKARREAADVALVTHGDTPAEIHHFLAALRIANVSRAVGRSLLDVAFEFDGVWPVVDGDAFGAVRGVGYAIHRAPLASDGASGARSTRFRNPVRVERLDRTLQTRQGAQEFVAGYRLEGVVGESEFIEGMRALGRRYATSDATVLTLRESGTDKEKIVQSVHRLRRRKASVRRDELRRYSRSAV